MQRPHKVVANFNFLLKASLWLLPFKLCVCQGPSLSAARASASLNTATAGATAASRTAGGHAETPVGITESVVDANVVQHLGPATHIAYTSGFGGDEDVYHHGLCDGEGYVYHLIGETAFSADCVKSKWSDFIAGYTHVTIFAHSSPHKFQPQESLSIAKSLLGTCRGKYDLLRFNCEHFVFKCLYGKSRSHQVDRFLATAWWSPEAWMYAAIGSTGGAGEIADTSQGIRLATFAGTTAASQVVAGVMGYSIPAYVAAAATAIGATGPGAAFAGSLAAPLLPAGAVYYAAQAGGVEEETAAYTAGGTAFGMAFGALIGSDFRHGFFLFRAAGTAVGGVVGGVIGTLAGWANAPE